MKNILAFILSFCVLLGSCKKKKDAEPDIASPSENFRLDKSFADKGSVLLYNNEYTDIQIRKNMMALSSKFSSANNSIGMLNSDGNINTTFGDWGRKEYTIDNGIMRFLSDQRMLMIAYTSASAQVDMTGEVVSGNFNFDNCSDVLEVGDSKLMVLRADSVFRLNADQTIDESYAITKLENIGNNRLKILGNKIFVFSKATNKLIKLSRDGGLDLSFGIDGVLNILPYSYIQELYCDIYPDHIYIYYSYTIGQNYIMRVVRYNMDGTKDKDFGALGATEIEPNDHTDNYFIRSLIVSDNGEIYLFSIDAALSNKVAVRRLNSKGIFDDHFGKNGVYEIEKMTFFHSSKIKDNEVYLLGRAREYANSSILMNYKLD